VIGIGESTSGDGERQEMFNGDVHRDGGRCGKTMAASRAIASQTSRGMMTKAEQVHVWRGSKLYL
jgi:hypothetical protein